MTSSGTAATLPRMNKLTAKWIWNAQKDYRLYNDTIIARRLFSLKPFRQGVMRISADSFYRLRINGRWVADGPCRAWPEHYQFDVLDVTPYLREGPNQVEIVARYYGVGTFHQVPRQAGLLAQLDIDLQDGRRESIASDRRWQAAPMPAMLRNTTKISVQMKASEWYDATLEDTGRFRPAAELFDADAGPWRNLHPRDVALMTLRPFEFKSFLGANIVRRPNDLYFCLPTGQLVHPGLVEVNSATTAPAAMATILRLKSCSRLQIDGAFHITVDGRTGDNGRFTLPAGKHLLLASVDTIHYHRRDKAIHFRDVPAGLSLENPLDRSFGNPWCFIEFPEFTQVQSDISWPGHLPSFRELTGRYKEEMRRLGERIVDVETFRTELGQRARCIPTNKMFLRNTHWQFADRQVLRETRPSVENPAGLMHDNAEVTVVHPSRDGDIELVYDLGEQNCGYYDLELLADEGVQIDLFGIEYIAPDGTFQHTGGNHNGMRYVTRQGLNHFTSYTRRGGRYVVLTLRNLISPARIRLVRLIESTYPVNYVGDFSCSDKQLDRIWEISARTLKLCMEDTFTDCPVYEQTLWVGDARNEAVFAFDVFGAEDIARRCIRLTAQSLERYPLVGCQVPSSWDCLLPAWSFLWGISVWDYYFYAGDLAFLKECWPAVMKNLRNADGLCTDGGLFSGPFWNMFEWAPLDQNHLTVLHNSMLLVGAIDAALRCGKALGRAQDTRWLRGFRNRLRRAINARWDNARHAYPDAILEDGSVSRTVSQHTSFLSILYAIAGPKQAKAATRNTLAPPKGMVGVATGFAMMYYFEALDKAGHPDRIVDLIARGYQQMLDAGATTVWEVFPSSPAHAKGTLTRSHCHAWSSTPVHFLPRVILGIRQSAPGGASYEISPRLNGLSHAEGTVATARGPLRVAWQVDGKKLNVDIDAPAGVVVRFVRNDSHRGLDTRADVRRR